MSSHYIIQIASAHDILYHHQDFVPHLTALLIISTTSKLMHHQPPSAIVTSSYGSRMGQIGIVRLMNHHIGAGNAVGYALD